LQSLAAPGAGDLAAGLVVAGLDDAAAVRAGDADHGRGFRGGTIVPGSRLGSEKVAAGRREGVCVALTPSTSSETHGPLQAQQARKVSARGWFFLDGGVVGAKMVPVGCSGPPEVSPALRVAGAPGRHMGTEAPMGDDLMEAKPASRRAGGKAKKQSAKDYLIAGRLEDVLALIQFLGLHQDGRKCEAAIRRELRAMPHSSKEGWVAVAKAHGGFFRVTGQEGNEDISLVARFLSGKNEEGKSSALSTEYLHRLCEHAIKIYDCHLQRRLMTYSTATAAVGSVIAALTSLATLVVTVALQSR
jgi:hypothetical protein